MAQIYPLQLLIASLADMMNRQQAEVLEYLIEENRVLKEQLRGRALRLNDHQRRRLAAELPVEAELGVGRVVAQYGLLHREPQGKHSDVIPVLLGVAQRARFNSITMLWLSSRAPAL